MLLNRSFRNVLGLTLACLGLGLFAGLSPAYAQSLTTLTPTPVVEWEDIYPNEYYFGGAYNCGPVNGSNVTSVSLNSTALSLFSECETIRTEFTVWLCHLPTSGTAVGGTMTLSDGSTVPISLAPGPSGTYYYDIVTVTPISATPVAFNVTSNDRFIDSVEFEYTCDSNQGCPGGSISNVPHVVGNYNSDCSVSDALIMLDTFNPDSTCETGPWAIRVNVRQTCPDTTMQGAEVFAVFPNRDQSIGFLDSSGELITDCTFTELPIAIGITDLGPVQNVIAGAFCCDCP